MTAPGWREIEAPGHRIRYRIKATNGHPGSAVEVEYFHGPTNEWRTVQNNGSLDWFALGLIAGRAEREVAP
mgnify:CR=1 FL=1